MDRLDKCLLRFLRVCLVFLNLPTIELEESLLFLTYADQPVVAASKKPGCWGQKFSNLKIFDCGILVLIDILQGT